MYSITQYKGCLYLFCLSCYSISVVLFPTHVWEWTVVFDSVKTRRPFVRLCVCFSPSTFNVIFLAPFLLISPWPSLSDWTKCQCCAVTQRQKSIHLRQFLSTDSRDKSEKRFVWACRGVHTGRPYSSVRSAAEWRKKHREHTLQTKHFVIDWIYL